MDEIIDALIQLLESGEELDDAVLDEIVDFLEGEAATEIEEPPQEPEEPQLNDNINLLWQLAGGQPQAFVSYLREFPDPNIQALLKNPGQLAETIQQLQQNNPITRTGQADGISQAPLQSSNVYGFKFNPRDKKLRVRFQGGSLYEYSGIPDVIFNLFSKGNASARTTGSNRFGAWFKGKNPSLGAALNQYIKEGGFPYRKVR